MGLPKSYTSTPLQWRCRRVNHKTAFPGFFQTLSVTDNFLLNNEFIIGQLWNFWDLTRKTSYWLKVWLNNALFMVPFKVCQIFYSSWSTFAGSVKCFALKWGVFLVHLRFTKKAPHFSAQHFTSPAKVISRCKESASLFKSPIMHYRQTVNQ